jgi:hypothetical protein
LRYTPLQIGGINLNGIIEFADIDDEQAFDERVGFRRKSLLSMTGEERTRIGFIFNFPWSDGIVEVQLPKPKIQSNPGVLNFNYEFEYKNIDAFLEYLDNFGKIYDKFNNLLQSLNLRRAQ